MIVQRKFLEACKSGNLEQVNFLINHFYHPKIWFRGIARFSGFEIDLNALHANRTPLMLAAENGHAQIIKALLTAGANVNLVDTDGRNAMMQAARQGQAESVQALLTAPDIQINQVDNYGENALLFSLRKKSVFDILIKVPDLQINYINHYGDSALSYAINSSHVSVICALRAAGAVLNSETQKALNERFLSTAEAGYLSFMPELIKAGAEVNALDQWGKTALRRAAEGHKIERLKALLIHGASPNIASSDGVTPLLAATACNDRDIISCLLNAGAQPLNSVNPNEGNLALRLAAEWGNIEAVNNLLALQSVRNQIDWAPDNLPGTSAIVKAYENGHHNIVEILLRNGAILPAHLRQVANQINGAQSVHEVSVHVSVSRSAKNLRAQYLYTEEKLTDAINELATWLNTGFADPEQLPREYKAQWLEPAKKCVARLSVMNFTDQRSDMSMRHALALTWIGINNPQAKGGEQPVLGLQEMMDRRISFVRQLYEIQRGYNLSDSANPVDDGGNDRITCPPGSFNKLIGALSDVGHQGVQVIFVTPTVINMHVPFLTKQAFNGLSEDTRKRFAQSWKDENSDALQAECFDMLKPLVTSKLHEIYDEFNSEVPNLNQVLNNAAANVQYTDMDLVMAEEQAAAAVMAQPIIMSTINKKGIKRARAGTQESNAEQSSIPPAHRRSSRIRSFKGSYKE
jgi:ankyrin repeat protein